MMAFALWKQKGQRLPAYLFKIPWLILVLWLTPLGSFLPGVMARFLILI